MLELIGRTLPYAFGAALSPPEILAMFIIFAGPRPKARSGAFALGWLASFSVMFAIGYFSGNVSDAAVDEAAPPIVRVLKLIGGIALAILGVRALRQSSSGDVPERPAWLEKVDGLAAPTLALAGFGLAIANTSVVFVPLAGHEAAAAGLASGPTIGASLIFLLLASSSIVLPTLLLIAKPGLVLPKIQTCSTWLDKHGTAVNAGLLFVFAAVLIGGALSG